MSAQTTQLGCSPHDPSHNSSEPGKPPGSFSELPQPFQKLPRPQHRSRLLAAGSQRGMWRANRLRIQKLYDNPSKINRRQKPSGARRCQESKAMLQRRRQSCLSPAVPRLRRGVPRSGGRGLGGPQPPPESIHAGEHPRSEREAPMRLPAPSPQRAAPFVPSSFFSPLALDFLSLGGAEEVES